MVAVSKTKPVELLNEAYDQGQRIFGENKVQETLEKWSEIKVKNEKIRLHLIGRLQTNKVKYAVKIFDYIHSVDNKKLATALAKYENLLKKKKKYFIQVNIGNEIQKSGINISQLSDFYFFCKKISLNIIGLMCIPPNDKNSKKYFIELFKLNKFLKLDQISMGMSDDYLDAIQCGSTFIRIGSAIFGDRVTK